MVSNTGDIVLDSKLCVWQIKVSVWSVRNDLLLVWEGNYDVRTLKIEYWWLECYNFNRLIF